MKRQGVEGDMSLVQLMGLHHSAYLEETLRTHLIYQCSISQLICVCRPLNSQQMTAPTSFTVTRELILL